ncbi:SHOCT domain-containing protein [Undibacterium sp. Ji42W]|uniref:SHOCT domain-containing protein n=1 Tax=Undibacterium sp. Ji42W TaxID=3413039 RepID=UPI003BEFF7D9
MVSRQAATGFSGSGTLKAEVFQEASQYCEKLGKPLHVVGLQEARPPYVYGNFPKAEIQFMCSNEGGAESNHPKIKKTADTVVEFRIDSNARVDVPNSKDIYSELLKLENLRKQGILTDAEFQAQKSKLLNGS